VFVAFDDIIFHVFDVSVEFDVFDVFLVPRESDFSCLGNLVSRASGIWFLVPREFDFSWEF